ncbi:hypothetical protein [Mesomycoplasma ovipneumoniae]|nr:hypothetical protein [Mesomycoplasma ovipneumoniae]WDV48789.1 hypothetical protein PWA39_00660 [Mesomycoplasma ovipneumoniae ATCC 29419]
MSVRIDFYAKELINYLKNMSKVPIESFNSKQEVYLDDKNSKFIKKI